MKGVRRPLFVLTPKGKRVRIRLSLERKILGGQKMLGIIGAMNEEVASLKEKMDGVSIYRAAGMEFCQGKLQGRDVVVVRSGIGKVNGAICSQILADKFQVTKIKYVYFWK